MSSRNWHAIAAWFRRGGPIKHKNTPRGGAQNQSRDWIDQGIEEFQEEQRDREAIPNEQKETP